MEIEVRDLQLVCAIADEGSVTRAGHRLHLTQSALSHQLRGLEETLGAPLFRRLGRRMAPTPAGERLRTSARQILEQIGRAEEEVRRVTAQREGTLRLSVECNTAYYWLPPLLKPFRQRFPRVEVRIELEATRQPIAALLDGRLDLAIIYTPVRNRRLTVEPLFQDELVVLVAPGHPLAARSHVDPADFASENFIIYSSTRENIVFQRVLTPAGIMPRQVSQVQLTEAMVELVKAGLGISVMARWSVAPHIASGALRALPLTRQGMHRQWLAASMRSRATPAYVRAFVELLRADPTAALAGGRRRRASLSRGSGTST